jgi:hypothetical protein
MKIDLNGGTMTVTGNGHRHEMHTRREAWGTELVRHGEKAATLLWSQFDYITEDTDQPRLVKYRNAWIDVFDMPMIPSVTPHGGALDVLAKLGWDIYAADSYWSATVVRFLDGDDEGFVKVATVTW